jgi:hypothetical protein
MSKNSNYDTGCINGKKTQITDPTTGETRTPYARILIRRRQIKSDKAKEYIDLGCARKGYNNAVQTLPRQDAEVAVIVAEQDARERAVRAFCKRAGCPTTCLPGCGRECGGMRDFLKYYDNDNQ